MSEDLPEDLPDGIPEAEAERARTLQMQLFTLRAQLESANFENKEAYRRKINKKEGELQALKRD
jgi:hypothetical protein